MRNGRSTHWSNWLRDGTASSAVEYAIILALVATALVLASQTLYYPGRTAANSLVFSLTRDHPGSDEPFESGSAAARGLRGRDERSLPRGEGEPGQSGAWLSDAVLPRIALLAAWGTLLAAGGLLVRERVRQARARQQVREIDLEGEERRESSHSSFVKRQEIRRVLLKHLGEVLQSRILVRHVMSRRVRTVDPSASVADLRDTMTEEGFHHLLVMQQGKLVGVLSDRDLCGRCGKRAGDLMTRQPLTVGPDTPVGQAITTLLRHRISCLPVVAEGEVQGILTTTDMLLTLQCLLQLLEQAPALSDGSSLLTAPAEVGQPA
jgi:acetoin utilization protein AcuB